MTDMMKFEKPLCAVIEFNEQNSNVSLINSAISSLAASKTCGLAMLIDKLLINAKDNPTTKQLMRTLINRLHHNSIAIGASLDEDPEKFILNLVEKATEFSHSKDHNRTAIDSSAKLFTKAIEAFETNQGDFSSLEYNWKEFVFHFYRSRLNAFN